MAVVICSLAVNAQDAIANDAKRLKKARIFKWTAWVGGSSKERTSYDCRCCSGKLYKKTKIIGDCSFIPLKLTNFAHILQFFLM